MYGYKWLLFLVFLFVPFNNNAQVINDRLIEDYRWENRLLLVFAPSIQNNTFDEIYNIIQNHQDGIKERDLKTIYIIEKGQSSVDGDNINKETASAIRKKYVVSDGEVTIVLIGKDGGEKLRQNRNFSINEIFNRIDQMPMRRAEMEEQNNNDE